MTSRDGTILGVTKIHDSGPASDRWNLVLLAEGYRDVELGQFGDDAQDFVDALLATPPFDDPRVHCAINIYRVDVASQDSGADDPDTPSCPGSGLMAATYFDATFCGDGVIRRLLVVDDATATAVLDAQVPEWHQAIVIVNSSVYGGSGGQVGVTSTAPGWERIAIHELGHAAFGLADEYDYYVGCGLDVGQDSYAGAEPMQLNVTTNTDRTTIKWADLIGPAVPLPTTSNPDCTQCDPQRSPVPAGTVGAFEGARYFHCGIYRPAFRCMMRDLADDFCPVCVGVIRSTLAVEMPEQSLVLLKSFEDLLHSFEALMHGQPCVNPNSLASFEGLLHSFERLLHHRQDHFGALEQSLLDSFECLLYSFEHLLDRLVGLQPTPHPQSCLPGGDSGLADLVPVAPFPFNPFVLPQGYCLRLDPPGPADTVRVIVRNQGSGSAGPSVTRVEFIEAGVVLTANTPALAPGAEATHDFTIPQGCYVGESPCHFRITVNATGVVVESNTANNTDSGSCISVVT